MCPLHQNLGCPLITLSDSQSTKPTFLFFSLLCLSSKHFCVSYGKQDWESDEAAQELCPWSPTSSYWNHSLKPGCPADQDPVTIPAQRHLSSSNTSTQVPQSLSYSTILGSVIPNTSPHPHRIPQGTFQAHTDSTGRAELVHPAFQSSWINQHFSDPIAHFPN